MIITDHLSSQEAKIVHWRDLTWSKELPKFILPIYSRFTEQDIAGSVPPVLSTTPLERILVNWGIQLKSVYLSSWTWHAQASDTVKYIKVGWTSIHLSYFLYSPLTCSLVVWMDISTSTKPRTLVLCFDGTAGKYDAEVSFIFSLKYCI